LNWLMPGRVEPYFYKSLRVRIRQRLDEDAVHHAENGRRTPDAKCQRQGGYGGEAPIAAQLAQAIADVIDEDLHKVPNA